MKTLIFAALFGSFLSAVFGESKTPTYTDSEAKDHTGEMAFVVGKVVGYKVTIEGVTLVNFGKPYPNQTFTVVCYDKSIIPNPKSLIGKRVKVVGAILDHKGTPQITVKNAYQIRIEEPPRFLARLDELLGLN